MFTRTRRCPYRLHGVSIALKLAAAREVVGSAERMADWGRIDVAPLEFGRAVAPSWWADILPTRTAVDLSAAVIAFGLIAAHVRRRYFIARCVFHCDSPFCGYTPKIG